MSWKCSICGNDNDDDNNTNCAYCNPKDVHSLKTGIGGWLLLLAVGIVVGLILSPLLLYSLLKNIVNQELINYSIIAFVIQTGIYVFLWRVALQFFRKKKAAPKNMITLLAVNLSASLLIIFVGQIVSPISALQLMRAHNIIGNTLAAVIWIPYWLKSKRVKATFIND